MKILQHLASYLRGINKIFQKYFSQFVALLFFYNIFAILATYNKIFL
jgi:hypothetical protein